MEFRIALCGSDPGGNSGNAACRILIASLTFDIAPACDPGAPDGDEIGDDPMGGCPESEGGIMGGKGIKPSTSVRETGSTSGGPFGDDEPSWSELLLPLEAQVQSNGG